MRVRQIFALLAALFASASLHAANAQDTPSNSDDLIRWISETGKRSVMRSGVAELLHLGSRPIAVQERAFQIREQTHLLGISVESKSQRAFIFIIRISDADNSAMIWHAGPTGDLLTALFVDPSQGIIRLRVQEQIGEFLAEKEFFRRKMREAITL